MKVDPGIFKAYDVRGIYPDQIDEQVAYAVGRAFARVLADLRAADGREARPLHVAIGHDMRIHSPALAEHLTRGLIDEGVHVLDIGMVGTEMVYYAVGSRELDGGVSVTASHNPAAYAGFKLAARGRDRAVGRPRHPGRAPDRRAGGLRRAGRARARMSAATSTRSSTTTCSGFIDPSVVRPIRVVLDGGNGMAGPMAGPLLDRLGVTGKRLYFEPNGLFPGHEPNPLLEENRRLIIDTVRSESAELGIAWDGDADRCFFIDETGEFVPGDFLTALLAESMLEREPGATILYDVRASRVVEDVVTAKGGRAVVNRVGHAFFKTRMREENAIFGGEVSGHYYFRDFWCADSGVIPALLVLELLSKRGKTMAELLAPWREKYFISGEINSEVGDPEAKMKEIEERYSDGRVSHLDGVSVDYDDWHFNVRPSNTEPLLRLNLEAFDREEMEKRTQELLTLIRS